MRYCNIKNKIEIVELSDLHHPNCKIARQASTDRDVPRHDSDSSETVYMTPEAYRATEAVEFIAEHLRNEEEYIQIREDWKYVAMVIDRLQLYIFFAVTTAGTIGILMDAPHIFEYVDQDKIIEIHKGGWREEEEKKQFNPKKKKKYGTIFFLASFLPSS